MIKKLMSLALSAMLFVGGFVLESHAADHTHHSCGLQSCKNTLHETYQHDSEEFSEIKSNKTLTNTSLRATHFYLKSDLNVTETIVLTRDMTICLNGHSIILNSDKPVPVLEIRATVTICDCQNFGHITGGKNGGILISAGNGYAGVLHMYGGTVNGNTGTNGGGVVVESTDDNAAVFTLYGGKITDNTAQHGGGVHISQTSTDGDYSRIYMKGGDISGNTATLGGDIYFDGSVLSLGDIYHSIPVAVTIGDLYLPSGKSAYLAPLLPGSKIGISLSETGVFTRDWNNVMKGYDPADFFYGSNGGVITQNENELLLTVHEHVWETDYSKDSSGHWIKCTSCSATKDVSSHTLTLKTTGTTPSCTEGGTTDIYACICGYATGGETVEAAGHSWETVFDSSKHWSDCKNCDAVENKADHELYVTAAGKAADCDEDGYTDALACDCGYTVASEPIAKKRHSWSDINNKDPLTHWYDCTVCDARNLESAHSWTAIDKVEADCTTPGREAGRYCPDCGRTEPGKEIPAGHDMVPVAEKAPTCTAPGHEAGAKCSRCGHTTGLTELPQTDHPWKEELDSSDIQHWRVCSSCGYTDTKTGHTLTEVPGKTPTCTEDGYTSGVRCAACGYQTSGTALTAPGHQPTGQWSTNETGHWHVCTECSQPVGSTEHDWVRTAQQNATCTEGGTTAKAECRICGYTEGGAPISATGHNFADTLIHDGTHHWYPCANCDAKEGYDTHSWTVTPQTDATCAKDGITEKKECICGASQGGTVITAPGHALKPVDRLAPKCEVPGHEAGQQCEKCSYSTGLEPIPAPGHSWQETLGKDTTGHWKICGICSAPDAVQNHDYADVAAVPVTCAADGREAGKLCRDCGHEIPGAVIPTPGHSWAEVYSHDADGHWIPCGKCSAVKDAAPHQPETVPGQPAGCETAGITEGQRCSCGYATIQTEIPATGHSWHSTLNDGSLVLTCSACQKSGGSLILTPSDNLTYDRKDKPVTVTDTLLPEHSVSEVQYYVLYEEYEQIQILPSYVGKYKAAVTVTLQDASQDVELSFEIGKAAPALTLTMEGWTYGEPANSPMLTGDYGGGVVTFTYFPEEPVNAGDYTVTATVHETLHFSAAVLSADFTVTQAAQSKPDAPYNPVITSSSIVFDPADALEYSLDGETWVTERLFSGLQKATEYTFLARLPGDRNRLPSPAVTVTCRTLDTFTVRYDANGGTGTLPPEQTLDEGAFHEPPSQGDLRRSGYNFAGWETLRSGKDVIYKAKWNKIYVAPSNPVPVTPRPVVPSTPTVQPPAPEPLPYTDIHEDDWFADDVRAVMKTGLMIGTAEDQFSPNVTVDRATAATVLYRLAKGTAGAENPFTDVTAGEWYSDAIAWCAANGIVIGDGNGIFRPFAAVTRQEMALMLQRAAKHLGRETQGSADLAKFADQDSTADWARDAVSWCVDSGLIQGSDQGLEPNGQTPRCQLAALLNRFLKYLE